MIPATAKDITAEWLNQALHSSGFLEDTDIVSLQHAPIAGRRLHGSLTRLAVAYDCGDRDYPKTMIAKWPPSHDSGSAIGEGVNLLVVYAREIGFYKDIAPKSPMRTPGLIYGEVDSANQRCALLLEDCSHYGQFDKGPLSREQANLIVLKLADFHAHWWDSEDLWSFPSMPQLAEPIRMALIDRRRALWEACAADEGFRNALPVGGWEAGLKINQHLRSLVVPMRDRNATIVHGDFHKGNMLLDGDTPDDPLVVLDWQAYYVLPGPFDLGYFLGEGSVTTELRRQVEQDVVKLYYQRLLDRGVSGYSHDECWADYRRGLLTNVLMQIEVYAIIAATDPTASDLMRGRLERSFTSILDNDATSVLS
jgi:hypothetical protein